VWVGRVAENRYEKLRKKEEGDDGAEGRDAVKKVCMGCWLVEVTRRWTDWCVGLAANANSREPTVGVIRQERSMVTARFVWVALTDCRKGKPGKGLSNCVVIKPGRRRTGEGDAVRRFHFRFFCCSFVCIETEDLIGSLGLIGKKIAEKSTRTPKNSSANSACELINENRLLQRPTSLSRVRRRRPTLEA
jgi:hypothetical protein